MSKEKVHEDPFRDESAKLDQRKGFCVLFCGLEMRVPADDTKRCDCRSCTWKDRCRSSLSHERHC